MSLNQLIEIRAVFESRTWRKKLPCEAWAFPEVTCYPNGTSYDSEKEPTQEISPGVHSLFGVRTQSNFKTLGDFCVFESCHRISLFRIFVFGNEIHQDGFRSSST